LLEEGKLRLTTDVLNEDLIRFRDLMKTGRAVDFYTEREELPAKIIAALNDRFAPAPRTFWINSNDTDLETHTRVKAEGLVGFNAESNNADHSVALRQSNEVFAMLNDGYGWTRKYLSVLNDRFSDTSKETTIVLMDPDSPSLPAIAQRSNKTFDEQVRDIWESVERLAEGSGAAAYASKRLRVLGCQQPISGCYFIFDRHIIWNPYLTRFRPPQLPRIELSNPSGRLMELLLTDAEVIRRELVASKSGDLIRRFRELTRQDLP
jgi:hypothetical protein